MKCISAVLKLSLYLSAAFHPACGCWVRVGVSQLCYWHFRRT